MHSEYFKKWIANSFQSGLHVLDFVANQIPVEVLTKDDIFALHHNSFYSSLIDEYILSEHISYFVQIFNKEELIDFVKTSHNQKLKSNLLSYLFQNGQTSLEFLFQVLLVCKERDYFEFLPELEHLVFLESKFLRFLTNSIYFLFLVSSNRFESSDVLETIKNKKEIIEYIFQNIDRCPSYRLPEILKKIKDSVYYSELFFQYKQMIYWHFFSLDICLQPYYPVEYRTLLFVLDDLLKKDGIDFCDLKKLNVGSFSVAYQLTNFVLKIGKLHAIHSIYNSPVLLQPLIRKQIEDLNLYFEIAYLCDTEEVTEEDVYLAYKEVRETDAIWFDPKLENIGKLMKNNGEYEYFVNPESIYFIGPTKKLKKAGDVVIIDLDFVWSLQDIDWKKIESIIELDHYRKYEARYQRELKLQAKCK